MSLVDICTQLILGLYQGVEFLDHRVYICVALVDSDKQFSKVIVPSYTLTKTV